MSTLMQGTKARRHEDADSQINSDLGPIVEPVDQFLCPQCKSPLDSACVHGNNEEIEGRTVRMIRVYCEHCDAGFACPCGIGGGFLRPLKTPRKLTGNELSSLKRIVDHNRFVIQTKKK
jgi:hypothetical protein